MRWTRRVPLRVVVVGGSPWARAGITASARVWTRGGARVVALDGSPPARLRADLAALAATGGVDLLVDLAVQDRAVGAPVRRRVAATVHFVRPGGAAAYLLPRGPRGARDMRRLLRAPPTGTEVSRRGRLVWVVPREETWAALGERDLTRVLARAPGLGRELARVSGRTWEPRGAVRTNGRDPAAGRRHEIRSEDLVCRVLDEVTCLPRQVVATRGLLLPATYRRASHRRLRTPALVGVGPGFVRAPDVDGAPRLEGAHFHLDNVLRGHFGHALAEQVALLWALPVARAAEPGLRVLVGDPTGAGLARWEWDLYAAAGIAREDVVVIDRPVVVERLVTATPAYRLPDEVHPLVAEVWDELGRRLAAAASPTPRSRRIFLTRRATNRTCHDGPALERLFGTHGFEVVAPEDLPLADQVALVREADVVAGYAGSAMLLLALAGEPKHVVTVGSSSYTAPNERLVAAVLGHRLDQVVGPADVPRGRRFDRRAFQSGFRIDPDGPEGAYLRSVLDGLGQESGRGEGSARAPG